MCPSHCAQSGPSVPPPIHPHALEGEGSDETLRGAQAGARLGQHPLTHPPAVTWPFLPLPTARGITEAFPCNLRSFVVPRRGPVRTREHSLLWPAQPPTQSSPGALFPGSQPPSWRGLGQLPCSSSAQIREQRSRS